ncbi:hypothetical protein Lal_00038276 [Lupinus albus]|nr:hypothetical protein Lal_00038276 [Lupinus albus]
MNFRWMEAVLPLGIIAGMLCVMGNAQYYIHRAAHGRPKHIGRFINVLVNGINCLSDVPRNPGGSLHSDFHLFSCMTFIISFKL